ncbi:MAG: phage holin family protein [Aeromicrobium sp.]|uniref:phage holin family protein n=1 Tax=Aeromicrobium sp. TaxID=1871063 RepID=UPI003C4B3FDA
MERFLSTWLVSSVALAVAAWLLGDNMAIGDSGATTFGRILGILGVGLVFTIINAFIAPIVKALSIPFIIITLGLALLVINALLLLLTEAITDAFDLSFMINGFGWAVVASIVISISQTVVGSLFASRR